MTVSQSRARADSVTLPSALAAAPGLMASVASGLPLGQVTDSDAAQGSLMGISSSWLDRSHTTPLSVMVVGVDGPSLAVAWPPLRCHQVASAAVPVRVGAGPACQAIGARPC